MYICFGGTCSVMIVSIRNELSDHAQIVNVDVCISHNVNAHGKGMNPTIFSPAMSR